MMSLKNLLFLRDILFIVAGKGEVNANRCKISGRFGNNGKSLARPIACR